MSNEPSLSFEAMRVANLQRVKRWHPEGVLSWSPQMWGLAMAGECGEACNALKKLARLVDGIPSANNYESVRLARYEIGAEVADTVIYADLLMSSLGLRFDRSVVEKFNAVSIREGFPERLAFDS